MKMEMVADEEFRKLAEFDDGNCSAGNPKYWTRRALLQQQDHEKKPAQSAETSSSESVEELIQGAGR